MNKFNIDAQVILEAIQSTSEGISISNDLLSRFGGDEFIILTTIDNNRHESSIINKIKEIKIDPQYADMISVSFGLECSSEKPIEDLDTLINGADKKMYEMKREFHANNA